MQKASPLARPSAMRSSIKRHFPGACLCQSFPYTLTGSLYNKIYFKVSIAFWVNFLIKAENFEKKKKRDHNLLCG